MACGVWTGDSGDHGGSSAHRGDMLKVATTNAFVEIEDICVFGV